MNNKIQTFLISLKLCIFLVILLSKRSSGDHYQYHSCAPTNCSRGSPKIRFPFYIPGLQGSYCGYPGFNISCNEGGFPVLHLPETDYVVDDIFYKKRSLRVYNAAVLRSYGKNCLPRITNTTLPAAQFDYVDFRGLYLFSSCRKKLPGELLRYNVSSCDGSEDASDWDLALYEKDRNFRTAMENCDTNVVAPVEGYSGDGGNNGIVNVTEVLRRGFVLNWKASDCSICENSGGRCGFNATIFHFTCFCPDRPHVKRCRSPGKCVCVIFSSITSSSGPENYSDFMQVYAALL